MLSGKNVWPDNETNHFHYLTKMAGKWISEISNSLSGQNIRIKKLALKFVTQPFWPENKNNQLHYLAKLARRISKLLDSLLCHFGWIMKPITFIIWPKWRIMKRNCYPARQSGQITGTCITFFLCIFSVHFFCAIRF